MSFPPCPLLARLAAFGTLLLLLTTAGLQAQPLTLRVHHLGPEEGLSQGTVYAVLQDQLGFVWFGTQRGLNRWDSATLDFFEHSASDPSSLAHNHVRALAESPDGKLWVGTERGLNRYLPSSRRFVAIAGALDRKPIRALTVDSRGQLWVGTTDGLYRLDMESETAVRVALPETRDGAAVGVHALCEGPDGVLWIGSQDGLLRLSRDSERPERLADIEGPIRAVTVDRAGGLWAGGESLFRRTLDGRVEQFTVDGAQPQSLVGSPIMAVLEDRDGRLWVGTQTGGLHLFDPRHQRFVRYRSRSEEPASVSQDAVLSLYEDRTGLLWIGTVNEGVDRWDPRTWAFSPIRSRDDLPNTLGADIVTAFAEDPAGDLWVGTFGGGLARWRRGQGDFELFRNDPADPTSLADDQIMALLTDRAGDVWIGTRQSGLDRLDRRSGSFRHYPPTGDSSGPSAAGVVGLLEDADGSLWIATFGGGLDRLDPERGVFTSHRHDPDDPTSLGADRIHDLILDDEGRLWIATRSAGLDLYDRSTGRFRHLRHDPSNAGSLPSDALQVLQIGDDGALWIGTEGAGLVLMEHYDPRTGAADFRQWTEQDGLADNTIFGLQKDDQGALWLSSHAGLTRFDPATETSHHFTARHGLQGNEFTFGAHGRGVDGELFFGGLRGFNAFAPSQIDFSAEPPAVVLTGLELGNRPAADTAPELIESLSLDHMQRSVAFEFAALDFIAPEEVRYAYRLVPFDDDWIETPRRRATYTNLDAGDYVFTVRATNADGNTSTEGLSIQVKVAAAPWNTWWARTAYLLCTLALLYLGVRWRLAGLERRSTELEALVATRTIELSDTVEQLRVSEAEAVEARRRALRSLEEALQERRRAQAASQAKSQFLSSMSHELRTPLNAVLGFAQLMERDTDLAPGHRESLHTILRSGEHLLGLINDVLSLSKIEAGKLLLSEEPFDLRRTVADLDAMLRVRAESDGLALHMEVAPGVPAAVFGDGGRLAQILLNLLGNAVKFTDDGQVSLRIGYDGTEASFEVEDSGCGIAAEEIDRLFEPFAQTPGGHAAGGTGLGLPISQELVRLMGGELSVESELGVGSRFRFTLPLPEADPMTVPAVRGRVVGLAGDGPTPKILAVDDAVENRELLVKLLGRVGFEVEIAVDGRDAVDRWTATRPDLVLMDIRMPGIDGYEATRRIRRLEDRESMARTPIVALTATAFEHDKRTILAAGCDDVITKPFRDSALFETIGRHLGLRYRRDQVVEPVVGGDHGHGEALGTGGGRILVAEDNAANQMVARRMLERLGYTVVVVNDGEAALDAIAESTFDLILMDVRMPRLDGLAASRRIHETQPSRRPPIVALTGLASDDERQLCHDAGMDDVLPKPFRLDDLKDMVERWLTSGARSLAPRPVEPAAEISPKAETQPILQSTLRQVRAIRPTSPDAKGTQPIDERALQQLRQLDDGTVKPLAGQIIALYLDTVPDQLAELRRAVSAGDRHRWRRLAHSLKNSSATLGADRVAATCKELESLGRQVDTVGLLQPRAQAVLTRLDEEARQALEALADARREVESATFLS